MVTSGLVTPSLSDVSTWSKVTTGVFTQAAQRRIENEFQASKRHGAIKRHGSLESQAHARCLRLERDFRKVRDVFQGAQSCTEVTASGLTQRGKLSAPEVERMAKLSRIVIFCRWLNLPRALTGWLRNVVSGRSRFEFRQVHPIHRVLTFRFSDQSSQRSA